MHGLLAKRYGRADLIVKHGHPDPMPTLFDTHTHLIHESLAMRLDVVLANARARGVEQIVVVATTVTDSPQCIDLASWSDGLYPTVGVQPNCVAKTPNEDWEVIERLARHPKVVALGETGLDRYWNYTPFPKQQDWFDRHLELAHALGKPVIIHCRECEADIVKQLQELRRPVAGVLHSFTGTINDARAFIELGLHISFAGMVTYPSKRSDPLRQVAAEVPLDRILVETDSPYLAPQSVRGKPNEPANVAETAEFIARLRGMSLDDFAEATTANARRLFGIAE
jgi:TatD DNase family protein